jgi:hypothetical protein
VEVTANRLAKKRSLFTFYAGTGFRRQVSKGRFQSFMVSRFQSLVFETLKLETLKLALQAQVSRQSEISFKPSARVCSKSRTRWRECSNSWMSAHTSACQASS